MTKAIIAALLLLAGQAVYAAPSERETDTLKVTIPVAVTNLVVNDDITVVLTGEVSREIGIVVGSEEQIPVKLDLSAGTLTLSRKKYSVAEKPVVYVPAASLRAVHLNGSGALRTDEVINLDQLTINLGCECYISLRSTGPVKITGWDEYEFKGSSAKSK